MFFYRNETHKITERIIEDYSKNINSQKTYDPEI